MLLVGGTTAQVIATANAMDELGVHVPIISSTHNGLSGAAKGIDLAKLNGSFSAFSFAPDNRRTCRSAKIYEANKGQDGKWGLIAAQSAAQALLALRILEKAVAKVGADKVTGAGDVRRHAGRIRSPRQELLGALPDDQIRRDRAIPRRRNQGQGARW